MYSCCRLIAIFDCYLGSESLDGLVRGREEGEELRLLHLAPLRDQGLGRWGALCYIYDRLLFECGLVCSMRLIVVRYVLLLHLFSLGCQGALRARTGARMPDPYLPYSTPL